MAGRKGRVGGEIKKTPQDIMRELGVSEESWKSPLEFLLAVLNNDLAAIGGDKAPTMQQRIDAARIASRFCHQALPNLVEQTVTHSWGEKIKEGESRLESMRKDNESLQGSVH
jgi:hypothetical protein